MVSPSRKTGLQPIGVKMADEDVAEALLPLESVGARLLRAREAAGLSRSQIAGLTRIPERHLAAIEGNDFAALPARPYAVGFSRTYAKALGLDQDEIVNAVRDELANLEHEDTRRIVPTFEPGDPARVPSGKLVWLAVLGILAVLAGAYFAARAMFSPGMALPSIIADETAAPMATEAPGAPVAQSGGLVVFTSTEPKVWVKFTDANGNQLFQKELAQGESWTFPVDQADVRLSTARPDALSITIGGQPVARLAETQQLVKDVPVTAAALQARTTAAAAPAATNPAGLSQTRSSPALRQRGPGPVRALRDVPVTSPTAEPFAAPAVVPPAPAPSAT